MTVQKVLAQKVRDPDTNDFIETMYFTKDTSSDSSTPSIYIHGKLADNSVIEARNLPKIITGDKIVDYSITSKQLNLTTTLLETVNDVGRYKITLAEE